MAAWIAAGLYDRSAPGAAERLELLTFLTDHGCTVEEMVALYERVYDLAGP